MEGAPVGENGTWCDCGGHFLKKWNKQMVVHLLQSVLTMISNKEAQAEMHSSQ